MATEYPYLYTPAKATLVLEELMDGKSLRAICHEHADALPVRSTVQKWITYNVDDFAAHYARARDIGLDCMAEDIVDIADTPAEAVETTEEDSPLNGVKNTRKVRDATEHRRLRVETRKWYLSKLAPKRYGDKLALEHSGDVNIYERVRQARARSKSV